MCEGVNAVGTNARFCRPNSVALNAAAPDTLYVNDYYSNCVRAVNITSGSVSSFAGDIAWYGHVDGVGTNAMFNGLNGIAYGAGAVFVTEPNYIRATDVATRTTTTLAGRGWPAACTNGVGTNADFHYPGGVAFHSGSVYVGDNCGWIRTIDVATSAVTVLVGGGSGDGVGTNAGLGKAVAITISASGSLYFTCDGQVRAVDIATRTVTTIAGAGDNNYANGVGTMASFYRPSGIGFDAALGALYVADSSNSIIRLVDIGTRTVSDLVGAGNVFDLIDGRGSSATFYGMGGMAVDSMGNIYMADYYNTAIRVIARAGV